MTRAEAHDRIEHLERLGRREGIFTKYWFKDGGVEETFHGYKLETTWNEPHCREQIEDANAIYLYLSYNFEEDEDWGPSQIDVTKLTDAEFVALVRSLRLRVPRVVNHY